MMRHRFQDFDEYQLLKQITEEGWTDQHHKAFHRHYDYEIGIQTIRLLRSKEIIQAVEQRQLIRFVKSRDQGKNQEPSVDSFCLEALHYVYHSIYQELYEKRFVDTFVEKKSSGEINTGFPSYLNGTIHNKLRDFLRQGQLSERQLLNALVRAKQPKAILHQIRTLKGRYWNRARDYLRFVLPKHQGPQQTLGLQKEITIHIQAITHYFFEVYVRSAFTHLKDQIPSGESNIDRLLKEFCKDNYTSGTLEHKILTYRCQVSSLHDGTMRLRPPEGVLDEDYFDHLKSSDDQQLFAGSARLERAFYWDKLIRCHNLDSNEIAYLRTLSSALEERLFTKSCG